MAKIEGVHAKIAARLASFAGLSLLGAVAPLVVLPAVARVGAVDGWAALAIGQSIGSVFGILVSLGFNTVGPARLPNLGRQARYAVFCSVQRKRLLAYAITTPLACVAAAVLAPGGQEAMAALTAIATGMSGLSINWFSVGMGEPRLLALFEAIPKVLASLGSLAVILYTRQVLAYPLFLMIASAIAVMAFYRHARRGQGEGTLAHADNDRLDWSAAASELSASAYVATPLILAALLLPPSGVGQLGSLDKVYRYALFAIVAISNSTLSWVLEPGRTKSERRRLSAILASVGIAVSLALLLLGSSATELLFGTSVASPASLTPGYALAYFSVAASTAVVQFYLVPEGRTATVFRITLASAVLGLTAMFQLGVHLGPEGISAGFGLSELACLLLSLAALAAARRPSVAEIREGTPL